MKNLTIEQRLVTPGDRLKYVRSLLRLSRAYVEQQYLIPEVTLKSWENGSAKLTINGAKRCIEAYKSEGVIVSEDWILHGIGLDPTASLSVSHYFAVPTNKDLPTEDDEISMLRDANEFKEKYPNAVIMMVSGDEMRPFYKPGDYVGGKMRFGEEGISSAVNKNAIVYLKDGSHYFRRLVKNINGTFNLTCLNPNENTAEPVLYNAQIEGVAPVIWHRLKDD